MLVVGFTIWRIFSIKVISKTSIMSLLSRFDSVQYSKNSFIKSNLLIILAENIKELQFEHSEKHQEYVEITDYTLSLCTTLEAIFLHGLKDSLLKLTLKVISSNEIDQKPEPSFWPILLIFSHKQVMEQIQSYGLLTNEIGLCRCWIRQALNDNILSSYFRNIKRNAKALYSYYQRWAILRDSDSIDMIANLINGIEVYGIQIRLPCNTSLLNQWDTISLQMSGIWVPPLKACPISSGIDIASSLTSRMPEPTSFINIPKNQNKVTEETSNIFMESIPNSIKFDVFKEKQKDEIAASFNLNFGCGNAIVNNMLWKSSNSLDASDSKSERKISISSTTLSNDDKQSFNTLLQTAECNPIKLHENIDEILNKYDHTFEFKESNEKDEDLGFEIINYTTLYPTINNTESLIMLDQLCKLSNEMGIDVQNFKCQCCDKSLGIGFHEARVCSFDGIMYCDNCMSSDLFAIPARIIFCWDFKKYPVSKKAAKFLFEFQYQPLIDLKTINPEIYKNIDIMFILQKYRIQLNFIRAYLYTCCNDIFEKFHNLKNNKSYFFEHIHQYSINDLLAIPSSTNDHHMVEAENIGKTMCAMIEFGKDHILKCQLCSQKGFICEVCNSEKIIYPFDVDKIFRCTNCCAIFHVECLTEREHCPKCERKKRREDLPLLDVQN